MSNTVTIKDLAKMSNVSVSTVSKALNERHDINQFTKKKIQKLAKEYNYVPNNSAISLRRQKTKTIAAIVPYISNILYGDFLSEIQKLSFKLGYKTLVLQSFASLEKEEQCFQLIKGGSVDGVIIISECKLNNELGFNEAIPTVSLNEQIIKNNDGKLENLAKFYFDNLISKLN